MKSNELSLFSKIFLFLMIGVCVILILHALLLMIFCNKYNVDLGYSEIESHSLLEIVVNDSLSGKISGSSVMGMGSIKGKLSNEITYTYKIKEGNSIKIKTLENTENIDFIVIKGSPRIVKLGHFTVDKSVCSFEIIPIIAESLTYTKNPVLTSRKPFLYRFYISEKMMNDL